MGDKDCNGSGPEGVIYRSVVCVPALRVLSFNFTRKPTDYTGLRTPRHGRQVSLGMTCVLITPDLFTSIAYVQNPRVAFGMVKAT